MFCALWTLSGHAGTGLSRCIGDREQTARQPSELSARFIAGDPDLTIQDYAVLYYEFLCSEWYGDDRISDRDMFIGEVSRDERFAEVLSIINRTDEKGFREELGLTVIHLLYGSGIELDGAPLFIDRLARLTVIKERESDSVTVEEMDQLVNGVMEYYMVLLQMSVDNSLSPDIFGRDNDD